MARQAGSTVVGETVSLCPVCLRRVPARFERVGRDVFLAKRCAEHGDSRTIIWRGPPDFEDWRAGRAAELQGAGACGCGGARRDGGARRAPADRLVLARGDDDCPTACGLCAAHRQSTCCVLLEVSGRCDLSCPVCFAASGRSGRDPSLAEIERWCEHLAEAAPGCNVQLSGGEPTVRDDLPDVIRTARARGVSFIQLNSNGLRLAREPGYAEQLAEAGLSTVFLQFDGVEEAPYRILRGAPLLSHKLAAVDRCAEAGLGVVLVPTLLPAVNTDQIGAIVELAVAHLPAVRGVHFQPISYFGRTDGALAGHDGGRITLPEVVRTVVEQTDGRLPLEGFKPAAVEHPSCSFRGEFILLPDGRIRALGDGGADGGRVSAAALDKARRTAARWSGAPEPARRCCCSPTPVEHPGDSATDSWGGLLQEMRGRTFSVTGMAFQDAWTVDLQRLRHCCLHVLSRDLRLVPFCAYNLTAADGAPLAGAWLGRREASRRVLAEEAVTS